METLFVGAIIGLAGLALFRKGIRSPGWWAFVVACNIAWGLMNA